MEDLLMDLTGVMRRHGLDVALDSAGLEIGYDGEVVFRCVDLNRRNMCENMACEMIRDLQNVAWYGGRPKWLD